MISLSPFVVAKSGPVTERKKTRKTNSRNPRPRIAVLFSRRSGLTRRNLFPWQIQIVGRRADLLLNLAEHGAGFFVDDWFARGDGRDAQRPIAGGRTDP